MTASRLYWKWAAMVLVLVLALVLVACGQEEPATEQTQEPAESTAEPTVAPTEAPSEPAEAPEISQPIYRFGEVADRVWVLVASGDAANPAVVPEGVLVTAVFSSIEPTVSGSGGCNNYFAGYTSDDSGGMTIEGPIGSTMMACEGLMESEAAYFAALETVSAWTLTEEGRLELTYSSGQPFEEKLVFTAGETPLTGTIWRLVSFGSPDEPTAVVEGTAITAEFAAETDTTGTVGGSATCNAYSTSYTLDGDQISFGPVAGTLMICPVGADQEEAFLAALATAQTFEIFGSTLQITYDGGVLTFTALNLPLENVLWQAVMVLGEPVPEGVEITALFTPGDTAGAGSVGGNSGCNSYNTAYETSSDLSVNPPVHSLTLSSPMAVTLALCPDESLNQLEQGYLAAMEAAQTYAILGDQLVVTTADGDIQFAADREPLLGTLWTLVSIGDATNPQPPVEGSNFTAQFNRLPSLPSGTVTGETGCNQYNATFTANLTELKVNLPATTRVACPDALQEAEQQFFLGLNAATSYKILGNVLQIPYPDGQVMTFMATQPPVEEGALDLSPLDDTFWYLAAIGDNSLLPFTEITAGFTVDEGGLTGAISGSGGCNAYNAAIGENFAVGPIVSTQRACPQEVMDQEGGYFDWLSKAYVFSRAGDQLLISTANGVLTYSSRPVQDQSRELQSSTWYLVSVGNLTAVPGSGATTLFNADGSTLSGNTGCNTFNGSYKAEPGNKLTISGFASTQAACTTEELTKQEQALLVFLPSAVSYTVYGTSLQIQTVDGSTINYTSIAPAAPVPPTAVISGPEAADTGEPLTFDGTGSRAGSAAIVRYDWDMGDGTRLSGSTVQHAYSVANSYNVTLTVTDQAGRTGSATLAVLVRPVVNVTPPTAVIEGPQTAFVGEQVTFSAAGSIQGTQPITNYIWDSGDGNKTGQVQSNSFTTVYARPGTYYASVTVVDSSGLSDTASIPILVNATLEGTTWLLQNTIPGTAVSLAFENGFLSGFGGCNTYNAGYSTTRAAGPTNNITVGPLTSTGALCSEEIMSQEQAYFSSLQSAASYTISGSSLTLTTADATLIFEAAVATPFVEP